MKIQFNKVEIRKPCQFSEFDIQAKLFNELTAAGYDVSGEVSPPAEYKSRVGAMRFDLVIFENSIASRIIEVKAKRVGQNVIQKYLCFGIPVDLVLPKTAGLYVDWLKSNPSGSFGHNLDFVPIERIEKRLKPKNSKKLGRYVCTTCGKFQALPATMFSAGSTNPACSCGGVLANSKNMVIS